MSPVPPRSARRVRAVLLTFLLASWSATVLGVREPQMLALITFAWTATAVLRLSVADREQSHVGLLSTLRLLAAGLAVSALPALRQLNPEWLFWQALPVPDLLVPVAVAVAIAWPLGPFWHPGLRKEPSALQPYDTPVLGACFCLLSGSVVPLLVAVTAVAPWLVRAALGVPLTGTGRWAASVAPPLPHALAAAGTEPAGLQPHADWAQA